MKKIVEKIYVYKVLLPYKNWYSIMTDNGMVRNNIIIVGKNEIPSFDEILEANKDVLERIKEKGD